MTSKQRVEEIYAMIEAGVTRIRRTTTKQFHADKTDPDRITSTETVEEIFEAIPQEDLVFENLTRQIAAMDDEEEEYCDNPLHNHHREETVH